MALGWHDRIWQVAAPCNVACGSGIMTLNSPGGSTLQFGTWLWDHDIEFTRWQHAARWHVALGWHDIEFARWQHPVIRRVALGSWHWIRLVAAPCNVARGSGMTCHWLRRKRPPYWNYTSGIDFDHITTVDMSFCTSLRHFIEIRPPKAEKMTSCRFSRWRRLDFRGPIMGFLKKPMYDFL